MPDGLFKLFVISAITMGLSHTIAKERICEPLRTRLGGKDTWFGYLVSCPYCASHWVAFVLVPLTGAYYVDVVPEWGFFSTILNWFLSSVLVAVVAAFLRVIFYFVDETQGLRRREQKKVEVEAETLETSGPASGVVVVPPSTAAPPREAAGARR